MFKKKKSMDGDISQIKPESDSQSFSSGNININITTNPENKTADTAKRKSFLGIKIFTGIASASLMVYSIFCVSMAISSKSFHKQNIDSYILLSNTNYSNSRITYEAFGKNNQRKLKDYAVIGNKLFLSEHKITNTMFSNPDESGWISSNNNFSLLNLTTNASEYHRTNFANHLNYIDLSKCEEGDYLIYAQSSTNNPTKDYSSIHPYSIDIEESLSLTFYTTPNDSGQRKRVTLKNNKVSPFTVISISDCGSVLPSNYFDCVLSYQLYDTKDLHYISDPSDLEKNTLKTIVETINSSTNYRFDYQTTMNGIYNTNASYSFSLSRDMDTDYIGSVFICPNKSSVLESGELNGYDKNPEIRENTGYLDKAGQAYFDVVGNDLGTIDTNHLGKESYLVNANEKNITSAIIQLMDTFTK